MDFSHKYPGVVDMVKKYIYFVRPSDENVGICIVATTRNQARYYGAKMLGWDYIDTVAKRICEADEDMKIGQEVEDWQYCMEIGAFQFYEGGTCPRCGAEDTMVFYDSRYGFYCAVCEDDDELNEASRDAYERAKWVMETIPKSPVDANHIILDGGFYPRGGKDHIWFIEDKRTGVVFMLDYEKNEIKNIGKR